MVGAALVPRQELQSTPAQVSVLRWLVAIGLVTAIVTAGTGIVPVKLVPLVTLAAGPLSGTASLSSSPCHATAGCTMGTSGTVSTRDTSGTLSTR